MLQVELIVSIRDTLESDLENLWDVDWQKFRFVKSYTALDHETFALRNCSNICCESWWAAERHKRPYNQMLSESIFGYPKRRHEFMWEFSSVPQPTDSWFTSTKLFETENFPSQALRLPHVTIKSRK